MARNAYDYSLDLLSGRAYTIRNLRRKLDRRAFPAEEIAAAIERLVRAGLLDDAHYAREYARQRLKSGGVAVRRVELELARRGIGREEVAGAIRAVIEQEPVDAGASIDAAARKKVASMGNVAPEVRRRRLFAFLARRGFDLADITGAVERHVIVEGS